MVEVLVQELHSRQKDISVSHLTCSLSPFIHPSIHLSPPFFLFGGVAGVFIPQHQQIFEIANGLGSRRGTYVICGLGDIGERWRGHGEGILEDKVCGGV